MTESRERLSIGYVGTLPPHPGGSAISGSQLVLEFARLGHKVWALAPITAEALRSGDRFAVSHPEIGVTRFRVPYFETSPDSPPPAEYRRLEHEQIQEGLPLLIRRESFAWHVPDIARARSVPCILRIAGATTAGILKHTYPEALARQLLEQFRKVDLIITPARHLTDSLRQLACNNIATIPNAVDLHQFSPKPKDGRLLRQLAIKDDDIIVVHASNLKPLKRPLDLVYSAEKALPRNPNLCYVIVGDGSCRHPMEDLCVRRRVSERFRFVGWTDYARVPEYINLADLVIMPSESEGLARMYLETQACARLLLASDIPAAREVIVDGETGLLFRTGDIGDLTTKTLTAAGDPELRAGIGRKAWQRVRTNALDHAVGAYVDALEAVVRHHRG
jgi:glycosyltransferase involved in cell wall biosynthesis